MEIIDVTTMTPRDDRFVHVMTKGDEWVHCKYNDGEFIDINGQDVTQQVLGWTYSILGETDLDQSLTLLIETITSMDLKMRGSCYYGKSPWHDNNSFAISAEKGIFKCFATGRGGKISELKQYIDETT